MNLRGIALIGVLSLLAAGPEVPTLPEIQQAYDGGKYQDVVKMVAPALALKGNAAAGYDRAKLLELKAESHLRLKQYGMASDSFAAAAKETSDDTLVSTYRATALLVKRSQTGRYIPKQPTTQQADPKAKPQPIDIVETASRKQALAALFNDEAKVTLAKVESIKKQPTLAPVMTGIKQIGELRALELAGTGATEATKGALTSLGEHANTLMGAAIKKMSETTEKLEKTANQTTTEQRRDSHGSVDTIIRKRGLFSNEKAQLQDIAKTCKDIAQACDELTAALGADGSIFATSKESAAALQSRADELAKTNHEPTITGYQRNRP